MRKVEIITKNNGNKKKHVIKIKSKSDLAAVLGFTNYYIVKDHLPDIDLTATMSFKIDGEKVSLNKFREELKKEIRKDVPSDSERPIIDQEYDEDGRIIIHSRKSITFTRKKNDVDKKKKKKNAGAIEIKKRKKKDGKKDKLSSSKKKDKSKKKKKKNRF